MTLARKDVPKAHTWNKEAVYPTWADWQKELDEAKADLAKVKTFQGTLGQGPEQLAAWFAEYSKQYQRIIRLQGYTQMHLNVDTGDSEAKGNFGQIMGVMAQFNAATAFVESEILALDEDALEWASTYAPLKPYMHHFQNILRLKPHQRSQEVEELLGLVQGAFSGTATTASELTNTDLKFADAIDSHGETHPVLQSTIAPTGIQSTDRMQRKSAWENYADGYLSVENTLASNYLTNLKQWTFQAKARGYGSVLELMLSSTNTPVDVFHNLINTFKDNTHVWHKYWDVKRKILGQDTLHPYDVWAPIVKNPPVIPYKQGVEWICEALQPLGDEYVSIMRKGSFEDRWVDWAPNAGKRQGAASSLMVAGKPPFIFTSYDDSMIAMSVLAHELGHSMHLYYTYHNVVDVYNGFASLSSTITETASNFNQAMLRAYLKEQKGTDKDFMIAMIDEAIFNFHRYFLTMPTLARLEQEVAGRIWDDKPVTTQDLKSIMKEYYIDVYGDTMTDDPERTSITWAQYLHLYYPFYTFQYAIGISAATAMADDVLSGKENAADNYMQFLKAGGSMYTLDLFKLGGVDMTSPAPVKAAFKTLSDMVDQLEDIALE